MGEVSDGVERGGEFGVAGRVREVLVRGTCRGFPLVCT